MKMLEYLIMCMSVQVDGEPEVQDAIKQTVDCLKNAEVGTRGMK